MIETERLHIREFVEEDFDRVHDYANDLEVVRFMPWGPNSEQETIDFIERTKAAREVDPRRSYELAVVDRDRDLLVGGVGITLDEAGHSAELGYCFHRDSWGSGYATEAAAAMLELAFDVLVVHRVYAGCDPDNVGSARVLQKIGMTLEGHLREDTLIRGDPRDSLVFGILRKEHTEKETT